MPRPAPIAAFALLVCPLASGCSGDGVAEADGEGRAKVTLWTNWTGFEKDALDELIEGFNASQPRIRVETLGVTDIGTKTLLAAAGGHPPDLATLGYFDLPAYVENNALTPLDGLAGVRGIRREEFAPVFWEACSYRGFLWAAPLTASVTALHYDKGAFRAAGLDPERPPRSLEELEAMNDALTRRRPDGSLEAIGHLPSEPGWWQDAWVLWFGGRIWDGRDRLLLDTPAWREMGAWLASYPERFGGGRLARMKSGFGPFASPQNPFFGGRLAMVMQGIWMENFVDRYAPPNFEYGVAPFPAPDAASSPYASVAEPDALCIPAGARHPQAAMDVIAYLLQPENLERLALRHRKITSLKRVSERFLARHPHPHVETFVAIARSEHVRTRPQLPQFSQFRNEMANAVDQILSGRHAPAAALQEAAERQQKALERQRRRWRRVAEARLAQWAEENRALANDAPSTSDSSP